MSTLILRTPAKALTTLILVFAVFLFLRGHNAPGGGFIAGLVAGSGFALYALAFSTAEARRAMSVNPRHLIAAGLAVAVLSGVVGIVVGDAFLTGIWRNLPVPGGYVKVGTPLLFDLGVFLIVWGMVTNVLFSLEDA